MQQSFSYAGFWKRFVAYLVDGLLLGLVNFIVLIPFLGLLGISAGIDFDSMDPDAQTGMVFAIVGAIMSAAIVMFVAGWLYFALMESSSRGATLGKMALGIKVVDMQGQRISFGRATGRYFGKLVSAFIMYIGFIIAAFTQQKQALHDIMAGCLVINTFKSAPPVPQRPM